MNSHSLRFLTLILAVVLPAAAHSVWIEPSPEGVLVIRFAEPDGKFEKSPGHLDSLTPPLAWKIGDTNTPVRLDVQKERDRFVITGSVQTDAVQTETAFAVMGARGPASGGAGRKPNFYARWQPDLQTEAVPALTLDLVPTGKPGEVRLLFRGQPVAGKAATFRTPDEKEVELTTDTDGLLRFSSSQPGLHLLTVAHHRETQPGFHGGKAYELNSHNASLTWVQK